MFAIGISTAIANEFVDGRPPLLDIGFLVIPLEKELYSLPDVMLVVAACFWIYLAVVSGYWRLIFADTTIAAIIVYGLRVFSLS